MRTISLKICDSLGLFRAFNPFTRNTAIVFMMHHFCAPGVRRPGFLFADTLEECLRYLIANGYKAMSLSEYVDSLIFRQKLYKAAVFTVDDGYADFLEHGFPIFQKYGIPVTVFVATDFIEGTAKPWWETVMLALECTRRGSLALELAGRQVHFPLGRESERSAAVETIIEACKKISNTERLRLIETLTAELGVAPEDLKSRYRRFLRWEEIERLQFHRVDFQPHTRTHPILSRCSETELEQELAGSRSALEARLKKRCDIFCYPNGTADDLNDVIIRAVQSGGYRAAFTAIEGFDRPQAGPDLFRLKRFGMPQNLHDFKIHLSGLKHLQNLLM